MSSLKTTSLNNGLSEMDWDNTFFFPLFVVSGFRGSRDVRHTDVLPVGRLGTAVDKKTGKFWGWTVLFSQSITGVFKCRQ